MAQRVTASFQNVTIKYRVFSNMGLAKMKEKAGRVAIVKGSTQQKFLLAFPAVCPPLSPQKPGMVVSIRPICVEAKIIFTFTFHEQLTKIAPQDKFNIIQQLFAYSMLPVSP